MCLLLGNGAGELQVGVPMRDPAWKLPFLLQPDALGVGALLGAHCRLQPPLHSKWPGQPPRCPRPRGWGKAQSWNNRLPDQERIN